jgi:hypothetical protein
MANIAIVLVLVIIISFVRLQRYEVFLRFPNFGAIFYFAPFCIVSLVGCEKCVGAFCADVLTTEPPSSDNPLLSQPNAFITPHIAWATTEARSRLLQIAIANVRAFASGKPQNAV